MFPLINHLQLLSTSEKFHSNVKSRLYVPPKGDALSFEIRHFAGKVQYSCVDMLSKNRNFLPPEVIQVFRQSSSEVSAEHVQSRVTCSRP